MMQCSILIVQYWKKYSVTYWPRSHNVLVFRYVKSHAEDYICVTNSISYVNFGIGHRSWSLLAVNSDLYFGVWSTGHQSASTYSTSSYRPISLIKCTAKNCYKNLLPIFFLWKLSSPICRTICLGTRVIGESRREYRKTSSPDHTANF